MQYRKTDGGIRGFVAGSSFSTCTSSLVRYKSGEGDLGCFSGPTVNCERAVTDKAEFECHEEWEITHA